MKQEILPKGCDGRPIDPKPKLSGLPKYPSAKKLEGEVEFEQTKAVMRGSLDDIKRAQIAVNIMHTVVELVSPDKSPAPFSKN